MRDCWIEEAWKRDIPSLPNYKKVSGQQKDASKVAAKFHYCLPESLLGVIDEIEQDPPEISGFTISRLKYLLSLIVTHKQDDSQGAYSILNMQLLKNVVPRADQYLDYLKENGIIDWINYTAGRISRQYIIKKKYDGDKVFRNITDQSLIRRIEKSRNKCKLQNSKKYPFLNKYVYDTKIDAKAAHETIEKMYNDNPDKVKAEKNRSLSINKVYKITARDIYIKVGQNNQRYHTNFTGLPSKLVQHLSIDGKPLTELDMRNSQPFFAVSLFDPSPEIQEIIGSRLTRYIVRHHLTDYLDVKLYTHLVIQGTFYDFMEDQFKKNGIPYKNRDDIKKKLFIVFFGENSASHYSKEAKLFEETFPNVYELFTKIKKPKHNKLAILLHRIEAYAMLDCVAIKIHNTFPELKFLTKHDSILPAVLAGEEEVVDEIKELMSGEIRRIIGFSPKIKTK